MIEFIVLGILVLFFVSLLFFVKSSFIVIAVNALVALFIILMIEIDLRNKKMHKPYMVGVAITITFLVLKDFAPFAWVFALLELGNLGLLVQALLLVYLSSYLSAFIEKFVRKKH